MAYKESKSESEAEVITMDLRGGYGVFRKDHRPLLTILADGTVRVVNRSDKAPEIEAKISAEELQDLLRFVIEDQHFFDFDSVTARQELMAEEDKIGQHMTVSDGEMTMIRIRTAERDHQAEFYALHDYATEYPGVKQLANLSSVQDRLLHLFNEIKAGKKG